VPTDQPPPSRVLALTATSVGAGLAVAACSGLLVAGTLDEPYQDDWTELGNALVALGVAVVLGAAVFAWVLVRGVRRRFPAGRRLLGVAAVASPMLVPLAASVGTDVAGGPGGLVGAATGLAGAWFVIRHACGP
jgi:hypothetical protein